MPNYEVDIEATFIINDVEDVSEAVSRAFDLIATNNYDATQVNTEVKEV